MREVWLITLTWPVDHHYLSDTFTLWVRGHRRLMLSPTLSGYRISPQALNAIIKRYNKGGRIFFDDYVACCVKLRTLTGIKLQSRISAAEVKPLLTVLWLLILPVTDNFRRRDTMQQGSVTFQYDDVSLFSESLTLFISLFFTTGFLSVIHFSSDLQCEVPPVCHTCCALWQQPIILL